MIRFGLIAVIVGGVCFGHQAFAADIPFSTLAKPAKHLKTTTPLRKAGKVARKRVVAPALRPVASPVETVAPKVPVTETPEAETDLAVLAPKPDAAAQEMELSWFLERLVANVDGAKGEDSASMEGNLIVVEPGYVSQPYMVIELTGHVVKTPATTVRVDVKIGTVQRSVSWTADEVKSGRFSVSINAPMTAGKLPGYFPVSALAFVTRDGKQGVAMVSVEKIRVRMGQISQVATQ